MGWESCLRYLEWSGRVAGLPSLSGESAFAQQWGEGRKLCPGIWPGAHYETCGGRQSSAREGRNPGREAKTEWPELTGFREELEY